MLVACWGAKGGTGVTVVAAAIGLLVARTDGTAGGTVLADLAGDVPAVLGIAEPSGPGLADWLGAGEQVGRDALASLTVDVAPGLKLLPRGSMPLPPAPGERLASALASEPAVVVADCGLLPGPAEEVAAIATVSLCVLRPCYLALRRAAALPLRPSGVVLVEEPGRALTRRDVEVVLGVPVRAVVPVDERIARAVDAGLLATALPRVLARALRGAA